MPKEVIEQYLRANYPKYSIEQLKKKLTEQGYPLQEIQEVADKITGQTKTPIPETPHDTGFKWLKWSGIFTFVLLALTVIGFGLSFIKNDTVSFSFSIAALVISIVGAVFIIAGWFKLANYSGSGLMRFGLWGIVIGILVFLFLAVGTLIISIFSIASLASLGIYVIIAVIVFFLVFLFMFVCVILVYCGLIGIRNDVKLALWAGILFFLTLALGIVLSIFEVYAVSSSITNLFSSGISGVGAISQSSSPTLLILSIISAVLVISNLVVIGLMFFYASQRYEK